MTISVELPDTMVEHVVLMVVAELERTRDARRADHPKAVAKGTLSTRAVADRETAVAHAITICQAVGLAIFRQRPITAGIGHALPYDKAGSVRAEDDAVRAEPRNGGVS